VRRLGAQVEALGVGVAGRGGGRRAAQRLLVVEGGRVQQTRLLHGAAQVVEDLLARAAQRLVLVQEAQPLYAQVVPPDHVLLRRQVDVADGDAQVEQRVVGEGGERRRQLGCRAPLRQLLAAEWSVTHSPRL